MAGKTADTRLQILAYIVRYMETHRYAPTREEIKVGVGLKVRSSVQYHLESLIADGYIERDERRHRLIRPTDLGRKVVRALREMDEADS